MLRRLFTKTLIMLVVATWKLFDRDPPRTCVWTGAMDGDFNNPFNYRDGRTPRCGDTIIIHTSNQE